MKKFIKHLLLDFAIIIGNMFLSHGLFWFWDSLIEFLQGIGKSSDKIQHLTLLILCALQISINILLYKAFLKKFFEPAEQKNPAFYILLPIIGVAIWTGVFKLLYYAWYDFEIDTYLGMLFSFLPIFLSTLIPVAIIYYLYLCKRVGEAYFVYMLSFLCVASLPLTILPLLFSIG